MSQRIATLDAPITVGATASASEIELIKLTVSPVAKTVTAILRVGSTDSGVLLWGPDEYDASGVADFWPVIEARIKAKAAAGTLF